MFFGLNAFSNIPFSTPLQPILSYNLLSLQGEATIDNLATYILNVDDGIIQNLSSQQQWDERVLYLAEFEDSLLASEVDPQILATKLKIKRRKYGTYVFEDIYINDFVENGEYIDRSVGSNVLYEYLLVPVDSEGNEGRAVPVSNMTTFNSWILSDDNNTYVFDLETSSEQIKTNLDFAKYDNYTEYPVVSFGIKKYDEGGLKTIPYSWNNNEIQFDLQKLEQIKAFINNKQPKYLKDPKGRVWKVITYDYTEEYMDKYCEVPVTISFKWIQIDAGD